MAKLERLFSNDNEPISPFTHPQAVVDDNGVNLEETIQGINTKIDEIPSVSVINNLFEGGVDKALSAEMGKNLKNIIEELDSDKAERSDLETIQDNLNAENLPVAKPTISVNWIAHNSDGTELDSVPNEGGTASSPIVEKGYKMRYEATYSWKSAEGYQDPTSVDTANSDWKDESTPPGSGVSSESIVLDSPTVTSDKTLKITLQAKEVGLKTNSDGYLVPASGFVRSSASVGVTFRNRLYYGKTRDLEITSSTLSNLEYKKLRPKENLTLQNLSTVSGEYYVYAFPIRLSEIAANGFTVWDVKIQGPQGFNEYTVDIINAAGVKIKYYVYRTVQSGSLSNTTLSFTY